MAVVAILNGCATLPRARRFKKPHCRYLRTPWRRSLAGRDPASTRIAERRRCFAPSNSCSTWRGPTTETGHLRAYLTTLALALIAALVIVLLFSAAAIILVLVTAAFITTLTMLFPITRNVLAGVPLVLHK